MAPGKCSTTRLVTSSRRAGRRWTAGPVPACSVGPESSASRPGVPSGPARDGRCPAWPPTRRPAARAAPGPGPSPALQVALLGHGHGTHGELGLTTAGDDRLLHGRPAQGAHHRAAPLPDGQGSADQARGGQPSRSSRRLPRIRHPLAPPAPDPARRLTSHLPSTSAAPEVMRVPRAGYDLVMRQLARVVMRRQLPATCTIW
jgi:hypothetical protein